VLQASTGPSKLRENRQKCTALRELVVSGKLEEALEAYTQACSSSVVRNVDLTITS